MLDLDDAARRSEWCELVSHPIPLLGAASPTAGPLIVCDRCWHALGGSNAVRATIADDGQVAVTLAGAAAVEALPSWPTTTSVTRSTGC